MKQGDGSKAKVSLHRAFISEAGSKSACCVATEPSGGRPFSKFSPKGLEKIVEGDLKSLRNSLP